MELRRGDVVVIVVPGDLGKPRPAVVVQTNQLGERLTVIVCPMSSDAGEGSLMRPTLQPSKDNGLRATSQVMVDKIASVRRARVRRVFGRLSDEEQRLVDEALLTVLGLAEA